MIFNVLSDGVSPMSVSWREPLRSETTFQTVRKIEKIDVRKINQGSLR